MKKYFLSLTSLLVLTALFASPGWASEKRRHSSKWYEFWKDHDGDHHDSDEDHESDEKTKKYSNRRFYSIHRVTPANARQIVLKSSDHWYLGLAWQKKHGKELIVPIQYHGKIIGDIKVHPVSGEILPEEIELTVHQSKISTTQAREIVQQVLPRMVVGTKIRVGKNGSFWEVPLIFRGTRVEEIKVGTGTGDILPDWHIEEEAYIYYHKK